MTTKYLVHDFKEYVDRRKFCRFVFWSENQQWFQVCQTAKVRMAFRQIKVFDAPNIIWLVDGKNHELLFDRVRFVEVDEESSPLGSILSIHCGNHGRGDGETTYTVVAS